MIPVNHIASGYTCSKLWNVQETENNFQILNIIMYF